MVTSDTSTPIECRHCGVTFGFLESFNRHLHDEIWRTNTLVSEYHERLNSVEEILQGDSLQYGELKALKDNLDKTLQRNEERVKLLVLGCNQHKALAHPHWRWFMRLRAFLSRVRTIGSEIKRGL